ncbi:hypothetical protein CVT24_001795 [Panaeolus cyanescens]|uniref:Inhibitor I9 domain-containing protein n=1 Tax=Panaeolus cyanescens TaxID=181874 RepID=A0A409YFN1_9AGAR|nr:hypothetical protein CVT24_001795 [Panaeolus cyanescens]
MQLSLFICGLLSLLPFLIQAVPVSTDRSSLAIEKREDMVCLGIFPVDDNKTSLGALLTKFYPFYPHSSLFRRALAFPQHPSKEGHYKVVLDQIVITPSLDPQGKTASQVEEAEKGAIEQVAREYETMKGKPKYSPITRTRPLAFSGFYDWSVIEKMMTDTRISYVEVENSQKP